MGFEGRWGAREREKQGIRGGRRCHRQLCLPRQLPGDPGLSFVSFCLFVVWVDGASEDSTIPQC